MIRQRFSIPMVLALMVTQVLSPAILWAVEQRGIQVDFKDYVVISAISDGPLTAASSGGSKTLRFGEAVNVGEELRTGKGTVADVLIGSRAVMTLGGDTIVQLTKLSADQLTIQVGKGMVRVAASANALGEKGTVLIQTPTSKVKTRGGIVRVIVNASSESVAQASVEIAKPYLASYSPHAMVAVNNVDTDIIQVEEGVAEILGAGPDGEALTVTFGQRVTRQPGQVGLLTEGEQTDMMRASVLAKTGHFNTPRDGVDNLVALQVNQATKLGNALTGAVKTGEAEGQRKDKRENVVNGATGGVQVARSVVNTLFGGGNALNISSSDPVNTTGAGFGGNNNSGFGTVSSGGVSMTVNGSENALLVFTRKSPVQSIVMEDNDIDVSDIDESKLTFFSASDVAGEYLKDSLCSEICLWAHSASSNLGNVRFDPLPSVSSQFTVAKELVLVGGTPDGFHGGIAPTETLIARGGAPQNVGDPPVTNLASTASNSGFFPTDRFPANIGLFTPTPPEIARANSTFVVETDSMPVGDAIIGGTLGQFSNDLTPSPNSIAIDELGLGVSYVEGAITATGSDVVLSGGATLDRGTVATIGTTTATNNYFSSFGGSDTKYSGSLLAIINGSAGPTTLMVQDRLLGVYDGSVIDTNGGNKALLSVLDAQLTGPIGVPLIEINSAFQEDGVTLGDQPNVMVTSAVVTRSTVPLPDLPLDSALLEASAPLVALTQATMTTTNHFADLAGSQVPSIQLGDALVALNAAQLTIQNGHLLNLNAATSTTNGFLFSLNDASRLQLNNGALFSLNNGSSLNLNASALGVFGSGANTLSITNNLCAAGCGTLVNSANAPFMVNGSALQVAGVSQDVVLPNSFNVFAGNPASTIDISPDAALFHVDDTSTLTINGTSVVKPDIP